MLPTTQIIGLIACYFVVEIAKYGIKAVKSRTRDAFTEEDRYLLRALAETREKSMDLQEKTIDILREVSHSQEKTAEILERIINRMDER